MPQATIASGAAHFDLLVFAAASIVTRGARFYLVATLLYFFGEPIRGFIDRLNADGRFRVVTNDMSTQVFGRYEDVMEALVREIRPTFERDGKAIFVMKVLGPLGQ